GLMWQVADYLELGDVSAADRAIAEHARLANEVRHLWHLWTADIWRAMRALLDGRFVDAEPLAQQALGAGLEIEEPEAAAFYGLQAYLLFRAQGRVAELEGLVQTAVDRYPDIPLARCWRALLYAETGREDQARRELEALAANDFADLPPDISWLV